ncbi:unnamed protein product [Caenorhabditis sp. 36 PRJEB53466]|nr:unnamed protein product [Caenorhabditis sp. 36 PRJEB53466]
MRFSKLYEKKLFRQLKNYRMPNEIEESSREVSPALDDNRKKKWMACMILLLVNLLNYMDRYTIVGVLSKLKPFFDMSDKQEGFLQTVFIAFYMVFAPLFGYLGDRYNRKLLMITGISIWILAVFASTFCEEGHYYAFLLCRGVVGIGEASYATIAPTVLSDLFSGVQRSRVFMIFYFAIPVGSGLGFITGSKISTATESWQWGVRFSPFIGIACLALMIFLLEEPVRGGSEGARQNEDKASLLEDIKYLLTVPTFKLTTLAATANLFAVGTMSWWTPNFIGYAYGTIERKAKIPDDERDRISTIFGIITCAGGLFGVTCGSLISRAWKNGNSFFRNRASEKADVYVCAISMFTALPFLFLAIFIAEHSVNASLILIFFAVFSMCLNWAVNVDVLMYVVVANRRATALAVQTLISHAFGDATSPYIVGVLSDWFRGDEISIAAHFFALQKALYFPSFMLVFAGAFFLAASFYVEKDRKEALFQMDAPDEWDIGNPDDMDSLINAGTHPEIEQQHQHPKQRPSFNSSIDDNNDDLEILETDDEDDEMNDDRCTIRFEETSSRQKGGADAPDARLETSSLSDEADEWDVQKRETGEEEDEVF